MSAATLIRRIRQKGLVESMIAIRKRAEGWLPERLAQDPIASRVFALRLQRLRMQQSHRCVTIGEPDFVGESGASQAQDVQAVLIGVLVWWCGTRLIPNV